MKNKKGVKKNIFYNFKLSLLLWIIGIFLLASSPAYASNITPAKLIELTNEERVKHNLAELTANELLNSAAEKKAADIIEQQQFSHNFEDKKFSDWVKETGYAYSIIGENLAINFTSSEPLFNAWLASPTHKKNILRQEYKEIGVAVKKGEWFGEATTLVVQVFGSPISSIADARSPLVLSEQSVPALNTINPSLLITSNLAEQYLNNSVNKESVIPVPAVTKTELNKSLIKNKTAVLNFFLTAVKLMTAYMALMLLIIVAYLYSRYLTKFAGKLKLLNKQKKNYYAG